MPWKEVSTVELRKTFVKLLAADKANMSELCRRFGVSRKTGYKLLERYQELGDEGLEDQSKRPKTSPKQTAEDVESQIVAIRKEHFWGGRKIHAYLLQQGLTKVPAASTISDILRRHNLLEKTKSIETNAYHRFEHESPNDLWQMDYKGHFALATGRCHPLTVLDDHSRFSLAIQACYNEQAQTVKTHLIELFEFYGLPKRINVDNGSPWGTQGRGDLTGLEVWLLKQGIRLSHSRPNHPQTNGKIERFHRSLKQEVLMRHSISQLSQAQSLFDAWRQVYNHERPHEALNQQTPVSRYKVSSRSYSEQPAAFEYAADIKTKKVNGHGYIYIKGQYIRAGDALIKEHVAIYQTDDINVFSMYFMHHKVKEFTLENVAK